MKKLLASCLLITCAIYIVTAQQLSQTNPTGPENTSMNFIKVNLTSLLIKNYLLQYERVLSRSVSAAISFRIMPETGLPYKNQIINMADITEPDEKDIIENLLMSNYAITPEVRYYFGRKKYGNGLYLSLFYQYGSYNFNNIVFDVEYEEGDGPTMDASADIKSHTGGLLFGSQWSLGKYVCLDWWILGPHFGVSSGNAVALSSYQLDLEEQQDFRDEVNDALVDADIPMLDYTISTSSDQIELDFDGPWGGIRFGLSLGVRF